MRSPCAARAAQADERSESEDPTPDELRCPLARRLFMDPVVLVETDITYEREARRSARALLRPRLLHPAAWRSAHQRAQ